MAEYFNDRGQPIGPPLGGWLSRPRPARSPLEGRFCRLEPLDPECHGEALYEALAEEGDPPTWTYLFYGPFASREAFMLWLRERAAGADPLFHTILDRGSGKALGLVSFLRIEEGSGAIAIGHVIYSPALRRAAAATEAIYLLLCRAFDELGYRRCEWRCDTLNAASRAAAQRYGFRFEGIMRQSAVYKGRSRDTACYAIIDPEWPDLRASFERWLSPANFDENGIQREHLSQLTQAREWFPA